MRLERVLLIGSVLFAAWSAHGGSTYCCTDDKGRQSCSDVLPSQCYGRAYREINERGITIKRTDAPLTAEQRAQKESEQKAKQDEERRAAEQRRKDKALLETYANEQEIDTLRDRKLADVQASIRQIEAKRGDLLKKQQKLAADAEFYRNKPLPRELQEAMRTNDMELKTQQSVVESKKQEMEAIRGKYQGEKMRYVELVSSRRTPASSDAPR